MQTSEPTGIVFYGDINSFTNWMRRVPHGRPGKVLRETYALYDEWARKHGFWIKKQFDGFIAVKEIRERDNRYDVLDSVRSAKIIAVTMKQYLDALPFPRPTFFRMRGACGTVWRLREDSGRVDYGGDTMVLGRRMLDYRKTMDFIVSESVYDATGRHGCDYLKFSKVRFPRHLIGIDAEDQRNFYQLDVFEKGCNDKRGSTCELCAVHAITKSSMIKGAKDNE